MKNGIKALVFDVGGSIFDWQTSTRNSLTKIAQAKSVTVDDYEFVFKWRRRMFETLAEVRKGALSWRNADQVHRDVLDELAKEYATLQLADNERDELNEAWHRMDVWPDVPDALERLRGDYIVSILTVLSLSIVVDSSRHAGINWDAYLSCEFLQVYKPEPEAYLSACHLFRAEPHEVMMVAVHPPDLAAAQAAGLKAAYVKPKLEEAGSRGDISSFEIRADDYTDLANQLCS